MSNETKTKRIEHAVLHFTVYTNGEEDYGNLSYEITRKPNGWVEHIAEPKGAYVLGLMKTHPHLEAFAKRVLDLALEERNGGYAGGFQITKFRATLSEEATADIAVNFYVPYQG